jgi:hypothetical protein
MSVFVEREAWTQAVQDLGAVVVTDPFDNNIAEAVTITLDSGIVSTIIDPRVLNNYVVNGDYHANTRQGIPSIRWTFPYPVVAFGGYFKSAAFGAGLLMQGDFDGLGVTTVNVGELIRSLGGDDSFVGVIGAEEFSSITYQADDHPVFVGQPFKLDYASFAAVTRVSIDIKPDSDQNRVNPGSNQMIPVAILTTNMAAGEPRDFDALQVQVSSVKFGPLGAEPAHAGGHFEDVDDDGDVDLLLHFRVRETGIVCCDREVSLTGETLEGWSFVGTDWINTVGCQ